MSRDPAQRRDRVTQSWRYLQSKASSKPESTAGFISLYIAVVAAIAVYHIYYR